MSGKGQLILKQNCRAVTSPKNERNALRMFRSFFGRSYSLTILFRDLLTFINLQHSLSFLVGVSETVAYSRFPNKCKDDFSALGFFSNSFTIKLCLYPISHKWYYWWKSPPIHFFGIVFLFRKQISHIWFSNNKLNRAYWLWLKHCLHR